MSTTTQTAPGAATLVSVTLENGQVVNAMTPERVLAIINGMATKGKSFGPADDGRYIQGLTIQGQGNLFNGPLGPVVIYNVDAISEIAMQSPKALELEAAIAVAMVSGDLLQVHNACRAYLNHCTISFNTPASAPLFSKGSLVQAQVRFINRAAEEGKPEVRIMTVEKVIRQEAERLTPKFGLAKKTFGFLSTSRSAAEIPVVTPAAETPAVVEGTTPVTEESTPAAIAAAIDSLA